MKQIEKQQVIKPCWLRSIARIRHVAPEKTGKSTKTLQLYQVNSMKQNNELTTAKSPDHPYLARYSQFTGS